ncbi:MAG TPA: phosphate/phosphite/phosphonate ABC transporter substrate-binding protein [Candidatus Acidoferrales bacterium]|nr:phosphate/phosphite/phosphonate ABC transporter substrate-binding protein [Candidatus Acidoferrales bacterium]
MSDKRILWASFFCALVLAPCSVSWARPLYIGSVDDNPVKEIAQFSPLAAYLGRELRADGVSVGKVVVAEGIREMAALLKAGKVDIYLDSAFPSLAVSQLSGSRLILRRWRHGVGDYHSVIFVKKASGIEKLEDLQGRMIAFDHPASTSGYFMPKVAFSEKGLRLAQKNAPAAHVEAREVGYIFTRHFENTAYWVAHGKVAAGAIDSREYSKINRKRRQFTLIFQSPSLPRQIVSHRADMEPWLLARIKDVLLKMDQSEDGRKALRAFETTKFDELDPVSLYPILKAQKLLSAELQFTPH